MKKFLLGLFSCFLLSFCTPTNAAVYNFYPTDDTMLSSSSPTNNYGSSSQVSVIGTSAYVSWYDLTHDNTGAEVPNLANKVIKSVYFNYDAFRGFQTTNTVYRLTQNFAEKEANWNVSRVNAPWNVAGALGLGIDYTDLHSATITQGNGNFASTEVTNMVKDVVDNGGTSIGFIRRSPNTYVLINTKENSSNKPYLTIQTGEPGKPVTWYANPLGGTCGISKQCTGLSDNPYPGSGTDQDCACALPQYLNDGAGTTKGEDTIIIDGVDFPFTTSFKPPSGSTPTQKTKVYGVGWDTGCSTPPELYPTSKLYNFLDLTDVSNVDFQCLDFHDRTGKGGAATNALYASKSNNISLKNVKFHGAGTGMHLGGISNWELENVETYMNHSAGWDGDIGHNGESYNTGTFSFNNVRIEYNGCYEDPVTKLPTHCCSQGQTCYGDGLGTYKTGGHWIFKHVKIAHNTSDGLDLLYCDDSCIVEYYDSVFEGNAGNQVKIHGNTISSNNKIIGNCDYFNGQPFTATTDMAGNPKGFDNCRAGGNPVSISLQVGGKYSFLHDTITSDGDTGILTGGSNCNGTESITVDESVFSGYTDFWGKDKVQYYWPGGSDGNGTGPCGAVKLKTINSVVFNAKEGCPTGAICQDPMFIGPNTPQTETWNVNVTPNSPAYGLGYSDTITPPCVSDGSCSAPTPNCGEITTGVDNCGTACRSVGPVCPPACVSDPNICNAISTPVCGVDTPGKDNCDKDCIIAAVACPPPTLTFETITAFEKWLTTTSILPAQENPIIKGIRTGSRSNYKYYKITIEGTTP